MLSPWKAPFLSTVMLFSLRLRWSSFLSCLSAAVGTSFREFLDSTRWLREFPWDEIDCGPRL